jgi:hypothetical protein
MIKKGIIKAAVFLIATILISTSIIVLAEINDDTFNGYEIMFIQEPLGPINEALSALSDTNTDWMAYDDFWGVESPIQEIHWWNTGGKVEGGKTVPANPDGSIFTIKIYQDDGTGKPGNIVCTYENVMPKVTGTGIMYEFPSWPDVEGPLELYYFEAVLSTGCEVSEGWISIVKTDNINPYRGGIITSKDGNDNMCLYNINNQQWYFYELDISFALYGYVEDLHGEGTLSWTDVQTGETLTDTITVENTGGPGTMLDWQVEEYMDWGDWTFSPESGDDLTPEDGPVTITVTVIAPDEENMEFSGELYIVNKNDDQDVYTIPVSLT